METQTVRKERDEGTYRDSDREMYKYNYRDMDKE
jgi:hypothetical protein